MIKDVVTFLTPGQEPIQIVFFTVITLGVALSVLLVTFKANAKSWQRKWEGEELDTSPSGLEVEHGSISELSQAVATPAEKLASMMPGLLLIVGLLGTFLGLGLALDKASSILQSSGSSVGAMDDSMQNLMAMMQGLGTKFKTSTWGIIAFILLKVWESWSGFEERRLTWCINKMKGELSQTRDLREQEKLASEEKQHTSLMGSSQLIVDALRAQTEGLRLEMAKQNVRALQMGERRHKVWLENFEAVVQGFAGLQASNQELAEQAAAREASHFETVVQGVAGLQASNRELAEQAAVRDASHFETVVQGVAGLQASNQELAGQAAARDASHFEAVVQGVAGLQASNQELAEQAAVRDASHFEAVVLGVAGLQASNQELAEQAAVRDASHFEAVVQGVAGLQASNRELAEQAAVRDASHFETVVQGVAGLQASNQELAGQAAARDASHFEAVVQGVAGLQASNQELAEQAAVRDASHFEAVVQGVAGLQVSNQELAEQAAVRDASLVKAMEPLGDIASFTGHSNQLLADFTEKSRENQMALQKAGETMGTAAQQVATAAVSLKGVVDNLNREMAEVLQSVKTDLNGVMTSMNQDFTRNLEGMAKQMEGATHELSEIMVSVKRDLGGAIEVMSGDFKVTMVGMAKDLSTATGNISTAIGGMSESLNKAMEEVASNVSSASKVQKDTSVRFAALSEELGISVNVMTSSMEAIGQRMEDGLGSVANSTQQMGGLARNFKVIAQSLETMPSTLQQIAEGVGNSSAKLSNGLDEVVKILTQSDRYASAAEAIMKVPGSLNELSSQLLKPKDELLQVQKSLTQLLEVASGINENVQALKSTEVLQEA